MRDSTITVLGDSSLIEALLACDSAGNVLLKQLSQQNGTRLSQNLSLNGNVLKVNAYIDSVLVRLRYEKEILKRQISELSEATKTEKTAVSKPIPKILKFLIWSGAIAWAALILYIIARVRSILQPTKIITDGWTRQKQS